MLISSNMSSTEDVIQPMGGDRQIVVPEDTPPRRRTQRQTPPAIDDQTAHCCRKGRGVPGGDEQSGAPGCDDFLDTAGCSRHHRQPARLRLEQRHAIGFVGRRPNEKICRSQALRD